MEDWTREVTREMLPAGQREICDAIGLEATLKLCEAYGGSNPYIPKNDRIKAKIRDKMIRREFKNGAGVRALAARYGLSERCVQILVESDRPEQLRLDIGAE